MVLQSPDGDTIDCVPSQLQPAFDHPRLKGHKPLVYIYIHMQTLHDMNIYINMISFDGSLCFWIMNINKRYLIGLDHGRNRRRGREATISQKQLMRGSSYG